MAINSLDKLVNGMGNAAQNLTINKASIANATIGVPFSLFRASGTPAQAAIPGAAAICSKALLGAFPFNNPTGGNGSYLCRGYLLPGTANNEIQFHDRLAHMGGLNGTLTTPQTVNVDASDSALNTRRGDSGYRDVQWWLEWYTDTGATAANATVTYTNAAGTSGRTIVIALAATRRAAFLAPIIGAGGEAIRSVQSVTLSATTGTAGSFGVTATRYLTGMTLGLANISITWDWNALALANVPDDACIAMIQYPGATTTGTLVGSMKMAQG